MEPSQTNLCISDTCEHFADLHNMFLPSCVHAMGVYAGNSLGCTGEAMLAIHQE